MNEFVNKKIVLLITTLSSFLAPFMGSSVFIGLPSIGKEFAMDAVMLSWISTSYLLAAAMFLVPFGRVADIYGRKKIFKYGIIIDIITSLLLAFSFNETEFIILRFLQGIGAAMIFGTGIAIFISWELKVKAPVLDMNLFRGNTVFTSDCVKTHINHPHNPNIS